MCLLLLVFAYSLSTWLELTLFAAFAQVENDNFIGFFWGLAHLLTPAALRDILRAGWSS
jgi:hypothetical protein